MTINQERLEYEARIRGITDELTLLDEICFAEQGKDYRAIPANQLRKVMGRKRLPNGAPLRSAREWFTLKLNGASRVEEEDVVEEEYGEEDHTEHGADA